MIRKILFVGGPWGGKRESIDVQDHIEVIPESDESAIYHYIEGGKLELPKTHSYKRVQFVNSDRRPEWTYVSNSMSSKEALAEFIRITQKERTMSKTLKCTVGLPRSGKTTWAREQSAPIVNPDSIRLALHGHRYEQLAEDWVWAIAKTMVRALFLAGHDVVILDATNNTKKRRDTWVCDDWTTEFVDMKTSVEECIKRAIAMNDSVILPVIERMAAAHEPLEEPKERCTHVWHDNPALIFPCPDCGIGR